MTETLLTIGQLAEKLNISPVTIRYYEKQNIITALGRSSGGYRLYSESIIPQFYLILNAKMVGFTLAEIRALLSLLKDKKLTSHQVKTKTQEKIDAIKGKIAILNKMQQTLEHWSSECNGKMSIEDCPILKKMFQPLPKVESPEKKG